MPRAGRLLDPRSKNLSVPGCTWRRNATVSALRGPYGSCSPYQNGQLHCCVHSWKYQWRSHFPGLSPPGQTMPEPLPMARPTIPEETHLHQPLFISVTCKGLHESGASECRVSPAPTTTASTGVCAAMLLLLAAMGTERDMFLKVGTELFKTESIGRRVLRSYISP